MAFTRQRYIQGLRDDYLKCGFGEFMCRQVALSIGKPDYWSNEVRKLLSHVLRLSDPSTNIKGFSDRGAANNEAVREMIVLSRIEVSIAKNKLSSYYPKLTPKIMRLSFDSEVQFKLMLEEFLPSFVKYLD